MELSNIMDNVPVGICVCMIRNGQPSEVTINEHMKKHLGIKLNDNVISTLDDFIGYIHPEDKAMCMSDIGKFMQTGNKLDGICRILNQNIGKYSWAHVEGNLIPRSDELSIAYLSFTDITALKEIESSLRESRQMYENAVKSSRLVLWKYDIINRQLTLSHDELTHAEAVKFGFPDIIENAPDSLANYFEENDMPQVYEAYHKLEAGQDVGADIRCGGNLDAARFGYVEYTRHGIADRLGGKASHGEEALALRRFARREGGIGAELSGLSP